MSPLMQHTLEQKRFRRERLIALPYPEKVRIAEQLRAAARQIKAAAGTSVNHRRGNVQSGTAEKSADESRQP